MSKTDYVKIQNQTRAHICHWPGCQRQVPPARWGCKVHWFRLPKALRDLIWATYRPGQEVDVLPSCAYLDAASEVQRWIRESGPPITESLAADERFKLFNNGPCRRCGECVGCDHHWMADFRENHEAFTYYGLLMWFACKHCEVWASELPEVRAP